MPVGTSSLLAGTLVFVIASVVVAQVAAPAGRVEKANPSSIDSSRLLDDVKTLSADEMEGRSADRPSIEKARIFIEKRFRESGLTPFGSSYRHGFTIKVRGREDGIPGVNFVGFVKGTTSPDRYIVVTAHYDHVGIEDGKIYNGADDNASGTAALFALASVFNRSPAAHSLIFIAFDAEERRGSPGSRHFVANLPVPKSSILLNVNMDMVSRNTKGELYAAGTFHYPQLRPVLAQAQRSAKVKLLLGHDDPKLGQDDWTNQSDHAAFHAERIPFIYFGVEDHADYHKPTDDFDKIMPDFYLRAVETILSTVRLLDNRDWR